jgi:hypothetical protein
MMQVEFVDQNGLLEHNAILSEEEIAKHFPNRLMRVTGVVSDDCSDMTNEERGLPMSSDTEIGTGVSVTPKLYKIKPLDFQPMQHVKEVTSWYAPGPWVNVVPGYDDYGNRLFGMTIHFEEGKYWCDAAKYPNGFDTLDDAKAAYQDVHDLFILRYLEEHQ